MEDRLIKMRAAFVLTFLLLGCVSNADRTPSDAIDVPSLREPIRVDGVMDPLEWVGAATLSGEFDIDYMSRGTQTHAFRWWVAGDTERLFFFVNITGISPNIEEDGKYTADNLQIFATSDEGPLTTPSDAFGAANVWGRSSQLDDYWNGNAWVPQPELDSPEYADGRPTSGRLIFGAWSEDSLTWEGTIYRTPHLPEHDGLDLTGASEWRMMLKLTRPPPWPEYSTGTPIDAFSDSFPKDDLTRATELDPSTWLRFRFGY